MDTKQKYIQQNKGYDVVGYLNIQKQKGTKFRSESIRMQSK